MKDNGTAADYMPVSALALDANAKGQRHYAGMVATSVIFKLC